MADTFQSKPDTQNPNQEAQLNIQRIYIKGSSFEAFNMPQMIQEEWKPNANIEAKVRWNPLTDDTHEVVLTITVVVKNNDRSAFTAKIEQAGVFEIKGIEKEHMQRVMGAYCPSVLFPYAREAVTSMAMSGSFPQLYLAPMNFDAIYEQGLKNQQSGETQQTQQVQQTQKTQTEETEVH